MFNVVNTNVELKTKMFPDFCKLIEEQFKYGGQKYGCLNELYPDKEATDYITDAFPDFSLAMIVKYVFRFKTQKRMEDLIKIATYAFILWLKYFTGEVKEDNLKQSKELRGMK